MHLLQSSSIAYDLWPQCWHKDLSWIYICDVIKQNELELTNIVFKLNKADSFFCFLLFVQSVNCLYLWNQLPNLCGVFTKLKPKQYSKRKYQKTQIIFFDFRLILLDWVTFALYLYYVRILTGVEWVHCLFLFPPILGKM